MQFKLPVLSSTNFFYAATITSKYVLFIFLLCSSLCIDRAASMVVEPPRICGRVGLHGGLQSGSVPLFFPHLKSKVFSS